MPDFFLSLPCTLPLFSIALVTFSVLHSSPLSSIDFVVAWWLTVSTWAWVYSMISAWAWVCANLGVGWSRSSSVGLPRSGRELISAWWWSWTEEKGEEWSRENRERELDRWQGPLVVAEQGLWFWVGDEGGVGDVGWEKHNNKKRVKIIILIKVEKKYRDCWRVFWKSEYVNGFALHMWRVFYIYCWRYSNTLTTGISPICVV